MLFIFLTFVYFHCCLNSLSQQLFKIPRVIRALQCMSRGFNVAQSMGSSGALSELFSVEKTTAAEYKWVHIYVFYVCLEIFIVPFISEHIFVGKEAPAAEYRWVFKYDFHEFVELYILRILQKYSVGKVPAAVYIWTCCIFWQWLDDALVMV